MTNGFLPLTFASVLIGLLASNAAHASSGSGELVCDAKGGILLEGDTVTYAEGDATPKVLPSKEISQTLISSIVSICETKDGSRFSTIEESILINMEHQSPWEAERKTNNLFLCTAASDSYPNQAGVDTNCVRTLTTIQSIKDTSLGTQHFVDGEPVDKLPDAAD